MIVALFIGVVSFIRMRSRELKEPTFAQRIREQEAAAYRAEVDAAKIRDAINMSRMAPLVAADLAVQKKQ